jgi:hypothetical protein
MTDIDRLLEDAGARWRSSQPTAPDLRVGELLAAAPRSRAGLVASLAGALAAAAVVIAIVAGLTLGRLTPGGVGGPGGAPSDSPAPTSSATTSSPPSPSPAETTPSAAPCAITAPQPVFVPPEPFLTRPPANYESEWYGTAHLFTMLRRVPEPLGPWVAANGPFPDKTFWWSVDWVSRDELEPDITVTGRRLDGVGTFTYGHPGTNASADFGTAMLVGIDYPSVGCWELTARYRDATLSYVVQVID